jgi:hypothetical protein
LLFGKHIQLLLGVIPNIINNWSVSGGCIPQVNGGILADMIGKYVNLIASRSGLLSSIASIPRYA